MPGLELSFLPLVIIALPTVVLCYILATEKGKNVALWTILSLIPGINAFVLIYLIGTSNTALEGKIDKILAQVKMVQQIDSTERKNKEENIKEVEGEEIKKNS